MNELCDSRDEGCSCYFICNMEIKYWGAKKKYTF